jgi:hypothetical protein
LVKNGGTSSGFVPSCGKVESEFFSICFFFLEGESEGGDHILACGGGLLSGRGRSGKFVFIPSGESEKVEKEEIAKNEEEGFIHGTRSGGQGLKGQDLVFFGRDKKTLFEGADVKYLNDGDACDSKKVGGIGSKKAGLNDSDDLEDESRGSASDSHVKACIKEIVLVFQKAEFEVGIARAFFDLADAAKANSVDGNLQSKKNGQSDEVG